MISCCRGRCANAHRPFFVRMRVAAASGRRSEMSEGLRSKFQAFAVRQRGNLGRRNRAIGPYGGFTRGVVGRGIPYTHTLRIYTHKILAKSAARRRQKIQITFHCDMCVGEKTSQTANMEFCRLRQNYACSRPQTPLAENSAGIFASKKRDARGRLFFAYEYVGNLYLICQPGPCWPQPFPGRYRRASWTPQP